MKTYTSHEPPLYIQAALFDSLSHSYFAAACDISQLHLLAQAAAALGLPRTAAALAGGEGGGGDGGGGGGGGGDGGGGDGGGGGLEFTRSTGSVHAGGSVHTGSVHAGGSVHTGSVHTGCGKSFSVVRAEVDTAAGKLAPLVLAVPHTLIRRADSGEGLQVYIIYVECRSWWHTLYAHYTS